MRWKVCRWVWQLCSPLYIGDTPSGSLNRTRLYIPARAMWGALTANLARNENQNFPDYERVGQTLRENTRLSYLFPAEKVGEEWKAWLPRYEKGKGLIWKREDGTSEFEDRSFRGRLLGVRPSTAIEPASDSAEEGSLREVEVINPYWRRENTAEDPKPVAMVGYLFCKEEFCKEDPLGKGLEKITEILIGGDTRYGLGRLGRIDRKEATSFFEGAHVDPTKESPLIEASYVLGHIPADSLPDWQGALECIGGWDMVSGKLQKGELAWAPGSQAKDDNNKKFWFSIREDGLWQLGGK